MTDHDFQISQYLNFSEPNQLHHRISSQSLISPYYFMDKSNPFLDDCPSLFRGDITDSKQENEKMRGPKQQNGRLGERISRDEVNSENHQDDKEQSYVVEHEQRRRKSKKQSKADADGKRRMKNFYQNVVKIYERMNKSQLLQLCGKAENAGAVGRMLRSKELKRSYQLCQAGGRRRCMSREINSFGKEVAYGLAKVLNV